MWQDPEGECIPYRLALWRAAVKDDFALGLRPVFAPAPALFQFDRPVLKYVTHWSSMPAVLTWNDRPGMPPL
ncbi:hypothetical protein ACFXKG_14055 [Streptomyces sp. NPDC059255]|uniref:hypothetical protein n=1 Tax=Streptomyces sp. NPDC059255 TaxID=3346793 RepID=UPI0036A20FE9